MPPTESAHESNRPGQSRGDREVQHGQWLAAGSPEETWGWGSPAGRVRAARRAKYIIAGAVLKPGVKALEIGCGTGNFTEMFAQTGATIIAVDISPELLARAEARALPPDHVRFICKRFEECDIDGPFDAVIGSSVLHHLDLAPALRKSFELLKPGGHFSFAEPNMLNPQVCVQKNVPWIKRMLGDSPDETAFVRWWLKKALIRAGFIDVKIIPFDTLHPWTPKPLVGFVSKTGAILEKVPLLREFAGSLAIRCRRPE